MGRTVIPGEAMSIRRNEMPSCFFSLFDVRTRQNIICERSACVIQIFCPVTT